MSLGFFAAIHVFLFTLAFAYQPVDIPLAQMEDSAIEMGQRNTMSTCV